MLFHNHVVLGEVLCQSLRAAQYRVCGSGCSSEGLREVEVVQDLAAIGNKLVPSPQGYKDRRRSWGSELTEFRIVDTR